jgi:hypothetical protein
MPVHEILDLANNVEQCEAALKEALGSLGIQEVTSPGRNCFEIELSATLKDFGRRVTITLVPRGEEETEMRISSVTRRPRLETGRGDLFAKRLATRISECLRE